MQNTSDSPSANSPSAEVLAIRMARKLENVVEVVHINEDNDPNDQIGRPNGYSSASIFRDRRFYSPGDDLGATNGASLEVFETTTLAQSRHDYIQDIGQRMPRLSNYLCLQGTALLRAESQLKPSQWTQYEEAFKEAVAGGAADPSDIPVAQKKGKSGSEPTSNDQGPQPFSDKLWVPTNYFQGPK